MPSGVLQRYSSALLKMLLIPAFFYLLAFSLLTYPLILLFSTHFFGDTGDGLQNVWNLWWIDRALTQLHQSPFHTSYIHYPYGTSLWGHTLNLSNGLMALPLLRVLTMVQVFNSLVLFSFVAAGLTAFLLCYYLTRSYPGSLIGGFIFTFSNYHFAHAQGHLNLISLEWIPLFVLGCYLLLSRPSLLLGVVSALLLTTILLTDYYYFLYSAIMAAFLFLGHALRTRDPLFFYRREMRLPLLAFLVTLLVTATPFILPLLLQNARDPFIGGHSAKELSLDLLALVIPGGHWRFSDLTQGYWSSLPGNIHESSVHIGLSVVIVLGYVLIRRRHFARSALALWYGVLVFFAVMSLGPVLHVWGREVSSVPLPYSWLEAALPPMKISGVPVRMMVMVTLSAAVLSAMGFKLLFQQSRGTRLLAALLLAVLLVEYLPQPIPSSRVVIPPYVYALAQLPNNGGILDTVAEGTLLLYYQTIHEKPVALGYIARLPKSVADRDNGIYLYKDSRDYAKLVSDYSIRYLVTKAGDEAAAGMPGARLLYEDSRVEIYDLKP